MTQKEEEVIHSVIDEIVRRYDLSDNTEVSITLVSDEEIRGLNRDYRGKDYPTDVLSFSFDEAGDAGDIPFIDPRGIHALGDIIISLERAVAQAQEYGHSLEREVGFLTVHGMLHLLGFDHDTVEKEKEMRTREEMILRQLNFRRE